MAGAIIGAGMFSLPFVFVKAGLVKAIFFILLATVLVTLIHVLYADIVLKTKGRHNFVGLANLFLSRAGFWMAVLTAVVGTVLSLEIYLVLSRSFSALIFNGDTEKYLILFWALGSAVIFFNLRRLAIVEFLITAGMIIIVAIIFLAAAPQIQSFSFSWMGDWPISRVFFIIGPLIFSLAGRVAVLEAVEVVKFKRKKAKLAVALGTVVPALVYVAFALAVIALSSPVSEDSVSGLIGGVHPLLMILIGVLGLLSLWSTYVIIGFNINNILITDLKKPLIFRLATVVLAPLALYFWGSQDFIWLVTIMGGVFLTAEGFLIFLIWLKAHGYFQAIP